MKKIISFVLSLCLSFGVLCGLTGCSVGASRNQAFNNNGDDGNVTANGLSQTVDNTPFVYKHVVIIGIDGAGTFFRNTPTPNIDEIFKDGATTYEALTGIPSISAQSWASLLHGVITEEHGVNGGNCGVMTYPENSPYPSVFRVIREQMPDASLASICNWNPVNTAMIENNINVYKATAESDRAITDHTIDYVEKEVLEGNGAPTLLFVHFDDADHTGHGSGFGSEAQLQTITEQDGFVGELYKTYEDLGLVDDTLFILTPDHGGIKKTHGGKTDEEMKMFYAVRGKSVRKGTIQNVTIRDTAAIVLRALGLSEYQPVTWTSRIPFGIFNDFISPESFTERQHENVDTPKIDSDKYITNFITDKNLKHYLNFDGHIADACGAETRQGEKLYFEKGYFGQAVSLESGYVSILNQNPTRGSFSVAFWINSEGIHDSAVLFSNKAIANAKDLNLGCSLTINRATVKFNVANGNSKVEIFKRPEIDYRTGWMHVTIVMDRDLGEVKLSLDFGEFEKISLPSNMQNLDFSANELINIGQDITGIYKHPYNHPLTALMDEFMMFDGALNENDLLNLSNYYNQ